MRLADPIDWAALNNWLGDYDQDAKLGQQVKPIRLMAVLEYLKHIYGLWDEALVERWLEDFHWQAFCGERYLQL